MQQKYIDRFHSKYKVMSEGCWEWCGGIDKCGYGVYYVKERRLAHRISYLIHKGDPSGLCVCHSCDNPACVNPAHLWLGTVADNMRDRNKKNRQGHPTGEINGRAKLTEADVLAIRSSTLTRYQLADVYNVTPTNIFDILIRKRWRHI